jgi:hypothetical protein
MEDLAQQEGGKDSEWKVAQARLAGAPSGVHDLIVILKGPDEKSRVELDWLRFE